METATHDFQSHYLNTVQYLRSALIEAYQSIGADTDSPREAARQLNLDKNLTWKISRIIKAEADASIASNIPGPAGVEKILSGLENAGTPARIVDRVKSAFDGFSAMVELHTTDRASLELMLDSWVENGSDPLEKSRKLAYQGNSGIWGIQAACRLSCHILAPTKSDPSILDYVQVGGFVNVQRLRPIPAWPLLRLRAFNDDGSPAAANMEPLVENPDPEAPLLLREFFAGNHPSVHLLRDDRGIVYELEDGPVGRTGVFSAYYGYIDRAVLTRYRDEHNQLGELLSIVNTPIETFVFDLLVHRDMAEQINPRALVYGRASGLMDDHERRDERLLLPLTEEVRPLRPGLSSLATPLVPRYPELVSTAFERGGWNIADFSGWRLMLRFPPMPSTVSVRFELPERGN